MYWLPTLPPPLDLGRLPKQELLTHQLPRSVGGSGEEVEDGAVNLLLQGERGLRSQVGENAVVEDDVNGLTCLDFLVSALAALDLGTKKVLCDVQATARLVDEVAQDSEFLV